ncbi:aryl-sulfate sulfotransferase [Blautia sp. HCP3S3_H10_1]|uniref:aryl-sulfate sulfotransferase n=1 Tax=unclassified Blautia TaxID=2648079 RepID=UPI003F8DEE4D
MKNKRYRELAAILVMATMAAGPAITVSAEENTEAVSGQAGTDDVEEGTAESAVDASDAHNEDTASKNTASGETASADTASEDTASENTALELTDRFAQQTAIDEALLQEAQNGYSLEDALIVVNPYGTSPLSAVAVFFTEEACGGTVTVKGKSAENDVTGTFETATDHIVPIYGLYNNDTTEVVITLDDGTSATFEVTTEDINVDYGTISTEMKREASYDYNDLTFVCSTMGSLYAVDAAGDIRFYTNMGGSLGVHQLENGHLLMPASYVLKTSYYKEGMIETDLMGKIYGEYMVPGGQHHDFVEMPDGNLLIASDSPDLSTVEDYVIELDCQTGEVVWELDMKDLMGTEDGQSASMDSDGSEESDWFHNNGLAYDEANDLVLLSARHKDAIVAVKMEDKSIAWILGDPTGWGEDYQSYFFTPEGEDFEWFYAQHNVSILDNGDIALFDNGTAKVKRVDGENRVSGGDVYSRAVVYQIDTENMTVSQVGEYGKERGADWYSDWISGVVSLDGTKDHLWITAGSHLHSDEENRSDYYPKDMFVPGLIKTTHIDQVDNGELSFELTISGDTYNALTFRSFRMPLYTEGKYDVEAVPEVYGTLGETSYEEADADVSSAQALPDGWNLVLDGSKISVNGSFQTDAAADALVPGKMILVSGDSQRAYALTQSAAAGDNGTNVTVKGWTSVDGLEGQDWDIYLDLDGVLYNTGYKYSQS